MRPIEWREGKVRFLDQTLLPEEVRYVETDDPRTIAEAIKRLAIRGAPLIGIAAAYATALSALSIEKNDARTRSRLEGVMSLLASTRPTAVNLFWALDRMKRVLHDHTTTSPEELRSALLAEAMNLHADDEEMGDRIGRFGANLLPNAAVVLTHCNTGALATGGKGTAHAVIAAAWEQKKLKHVYIGETRPLFQGARLTAWELNQLGIPHTLITDSTAGFLMQQGKISTVVVGADRIAANGDVANKVGTFGLAVLARHHAIPFYVAAPSSTADFDMHDGKAIPFEQRSPDEILTFGGTRIAPAGTDVYAPAFDMTPHHLIDAFITEQGILKPPYKISLCGLKHTATVQAEGAQS